MKLSEIKSVIEISEADRTKKRIEDYNPTRLAKEYRKQYPDDKITDQELSKLINEVLK